MEIRRTCGFFTSPAWPVPFAFLGGALLPSPLSAFFHLSSSCLASSFASAGIDSAARHFFTAKAILDFWKTEGEYT
jgi:hypothetical protein